MVDRKEIPILDVHATTSNLKVCDYLLNLGAMRLKKPWLQHSIQVFSYATRPIDITVQGIAYIGLRFANPFLTPFINLLNHQWGKAGLNTLAILPKLALAPLKSYVYSYYKILQFAWSLLGANMIINVWRGRKQTDSFFYEMQIFKRKVTAESEGYGRIFEFKYLKTPRKGISLPVPGKYQIAPEKAVDKYLALNGFAGEFRLTLRSEPLPAIRII